MTSVNYIGIDPAVRSCGLWAFGKAYSFPATHAIDYLRALKEEYQKEHYGEEIVFVIESYNRWVRNKPSSVIANAIARDIGEMFKVGRKKPDIMKLDVNAWRRLVFGSLKVAKGDGAWKRLAISYAKAETGIKMKNSDEAEAFCIALAGKIKRESGIQ